MELVGLRRIAPGVCFGGDTTTIGYYALLVTLIALAVGSAIAYGTTKSSGVVMIIVAMSVLAVGSTVIVRLFVG